MSSFDDDEIEFDFFDEPETQEATQRRRLPRLERPRPRTGGDGPSRPPLRPGTGLTPLLRLLGLVAFVIFIVVVLVFWVQSCQGASKRSSYDSYLSQVRTIAQGSDTIGRELTTKLTTPGIRKPQLASAVNSYAQQAQQQVTQAESLRPPGPLRPEQADLVKALQLRAAGLSRLSDALSRASSTKNASEAGGLLATQARLLTASDVVWQYFFHDPAVDVLKSQGVMGVSVPPSSFVSNPDLVSASSMVQLVQSFHGASTGGGGTPSGKHGDALVSVRALPQGVTLSTSQPTTVRASTSLAFDVAVQNQGCCREVQVPVTLTISATPKPIVLRKTIPVIQPNQTTTIRFTNIGQPPFGAKTDIKVEVASVPGEVTTSNNSATYPVFFSIG